MYELLHLSQQSKLTKLNSTSVKKISIYNNISLN